MRRARLGAACAAMAALCCFAAVRGNSPPKSTPAPTIAEVTPQEAPGLHNVVAYAEGFWSGSAPEGSAGFDTLRDWGVKTIISVDGAMPDAALAEAHGMRYVHLPIGYNGFDEARRAELARAVRDLPKPIYVHCHHGKHRSAGAAGTIAVSLGWLGRDAALARMKISGTAPQYKGLYACTAQASILATAVLDAAPKEFPSVNRPAGLVRAMVAIDEAVERLKLIEQAGWSVPREHPDLVPAAEAGKLADLLRVLQTDAKVQARPEEFRALLARNQREVQALEQSLLQDALQDAAYARGALLRAVQASCAACHAKYRD